MGWASDRAGVLTSLLLHCLGGLPPGATINSHGGYAGYSWSWGNCTPILCWLGGLLSASAPPQLWRWHRILICLYHTCPWLLGKVLLTSDDNRWSYCGWAGKSKPENVVVVNTSINQLTNDNDNWVDGHGRRWWPCNDNDIQMEELTADGGRWGWWLQRDARCNDSRLCSMMPWKILFLFQTDQAG